MSELSPYFIHRTESSVGRPVPGWNSQSAVSDGIGLDEIWVVIRRRLRTTLLLVGITLAITTVVLFLMTPQYTAQTQLLIQPDNPQVLNMTQLLADDAGSPDYDYYKTQFELLRSRPLAARVIRELQLDQNPIFNPAPQPPGFVGNLWNRVSGFVLRPFQSASSQGPPIKEYSVDPGLIDHYLACLKVDPIFATRLANISFTLPDPVLAARVVNTHVRDFVKREMEIRNAAQVAAGEFLKSQLATIGKRTEDAEAALSAYRRRFGCFLSMSMTEIKSQPNGCRT